MAALAVVLHLFVLPGLSVLVWRKQTVLRPYFWPALLLMLAPVPGPVGIIVGTLLVLLLSKLVMATTIVVGLSDTWLDLRARRAAPTKPGS